MKLNFRLLGVFFAVTAMGGAAEETGRRPITPRDVWEMRRLATPALSPDGQRAVFSLQEWSIEKNESVSSLWVVEVSGGEPRRRTPSTGTGKCSLG